VTKPRNSHARDRIIYAESRNGWRFWETYFSCAHARAKIYARMNSPPAAPLTARARMSANARRRTWVYAELRFPVRIDGAFTITRSLSRDYEKFPRNCRYAGRLPCNRDNSILVSMSGKTAAESWRDVFCDCFERSRLSKDRTNARVNISSG